MINLNKLPEHKRSDGYDGYIYVLKFSTGIVKVGKTRNPRARIATHVDDAGKFGTTVDRLWLSERHENYSSNETALLRRLGVELVEHGNEYLRTRFSHVVSEAKKLSFAPLTEAERSARNEEARSRAESLIRSLSSTTERAYVVDVNDELSAAVLNTLFAAALPGERQGSPEDRDAVRNKLTQFADQAGRDVEELLNWSYLDVITHLAQTVIKAACLELRIKALKAERYDLTHVPFFGGAA